MSATTRQLELSAGTIDYADSEGDGPVVVLLHGLLMDASLWDSVVAALAPDHRCITPTLPMGAHRHPMRPGADLSLPGIARLVTELLDRLDLHDVTLVGNDTGGALVQLVITDTDGAPRVARVVLVSCEAFDNLPPGLTGRTLALVSRLAPAAFGAFMQQMRLRAVRRLPIAFGWLTKRGDDVTAGWACPLVARSPARSRIRQDTVRMLRAVFADRGVLVAAAGRFPAFTRPVLVVWARGDRVMPPEHGRRLAQALPDAQLVEVDDSFTLVALDQPARLAREVRDLCRPRPRAAR